MGCRSRGDPGWILRIRGQRVVNDNLVSRHFPGEERRGVLDHTVDVEEGNRGPSEDAGSVDDFM